MDSEPTTTDLYCPHPNPPPWGEEALKLNSTVLNPPIPMLVVVMDVWPTPNDAEAVKQLAVFWRVMNQLREQWHSLPAQVLFLLSPAAYKHLSLNADHLKRWVSLKLRMWQGSTDLEVLARPGGKANTPQPLHFAGSQIRLQRLVELGELSREEYELLTRGRSTFAFTGNGAIAQSGGVAASNHGVAIRGDIHGDVYKVIGEPPNYRAEMVRLLEEAILRGESISEQVRRYYLPLITESLAMGDRQAALTWREKIGGFKGLTQEDREALNKLDEQLAEPAGKSRFDVFFSYNLQDRTTVRELASALQKRGLKVWLDEEQILAGMGWAIDTEVGIRNSASLAVLIGKYPLSRPQHFDMEYVQSITTDCYPRILPVLLPSAPKYLTLPPFLDNYQWLDLRQGITEAKIDQLVWGITGKKP